MWLPRMFSVLPKERNRSAARGGGNNVLKQKYKTMISIMVSILMIYSDVENDDKGDVSV